MEIFLAVFHLRILRPEGTKKRDQKFYMDLRNLMRFRELCFISTREKKTETSTRSRKVSWWTINGCNEAQVKNVSLLDLTTIIMSTRDFKRGKPLWWFNVVQASRNNCRKFVKIRRIANLKCDTNVIETRNGNWKRSVASIYLMNAPWGTIWSFSVRKFNFHW